MPGSRARSVVAAVGLAWTILTPRLARADEAAERLALDARRLEAEALVAEGDKTPSGDPALFAKAAEIYESLYRASCAAAAAPGRYVPDARTCQELAYDGARAFHAAHDRTKAIELFRRLVDADERAGTRTPLAARATYALGGEYQSVAVYDEAATWFERYATRYPAEQDAARALEDAIILRLALSHEDQAAADAATFVKSFGAKQPTEAATMTLALALHHEERQDWERARRLLSMATFDRAPVDLAILAHALLARLLARGPTPSAALEEYAKVRSYWRDPDAGVLALRHARPAEPEGIRDRRLARILNAVGEATFAAAEERRRVEVDPLKMPIFTGPADVAAVEAHLANKVRPWLEKKRRAIEAVEIGYVAILDTKPLPSPRWVVAAAAAVGTMWGSFADDFRRVPIPGAWRKNAALYRPYSDAIEDMSLSLESTKAKPAMRKCLSLSVLYQFQDPRTRACEQWLATHDKKAFHVVDELIPALRGAASRPADAPPLSYEGIPLP
ncbi:hypothetical protein BH11MYX4_BH11MYX4_64460 [soil metagenome]